MRPHASEAHADQRGAIGDFIAIQREAAAICAMLGLDTPRTSFEVLVRLEEDHRLPAGSAKRFAPIVGFRNRVVHLYDHIDPTIVYRVVTERCTGQLDLARRLLAIDTERSA